MKSTLRFNSIWPLFTLVLVLFAPSSHAQIQLPEINDSTEEPYDDYIPFLLDPFPTRIFNPYFDVMIGLNTIDDYGYTLVTPSFETRGGLFIGENMTIGSGLALFFANNYEAVLNLPLEMGYRSRSHNWNFTSSIGYAFIPTYGSDEGHTATIDAYWRPQVTAKGMKFTLGVGVMMIDFAQPERFLQGCRGCDSHYGAHYSFRLRGGIGF